MILTKYLDMDKVCAKVSPHSFSSEQKMRGEKVSSDLSVTFLEEPHLLKKKKKTVTADENWVFQYN